MCCGYSLEVLFLSSTHNIVFHVETEKNINNIWLKNAPYLELCIVACVIAIAGLGGSAGCVSDW